MSDDKIDILKRALLRQKKARKEAEKILEYKSLTLFNTSQKLKKVNEKLESLLNQKDSQLKGVFENINDAYLVIAIDGEIIKINDVAEVFFGYNLSKTKLYVKDIVYKEDYKSAIETFSELLKNEKLSNYIFRIINKKNQIKWVNISASIINDENKKPIATQCIVRDITKQREKQLVLDLVSNTAKSVLGKEDIGEIAWEISSNISNYLNTNDCVIYLVNDKSKNLEQIAAYGDKKGEKNTVKNKIYLSFGQGIVGSVAQKGVSEIIKDTTIDERYVVDEEKRNSEITVPIISEGKVIGIIDAEHKDKNYFTQVHLNTIENIASLVSLQLKSAINIRERKRIEQKNKDLVNKLSRSNEELKEYAHIVSHDLKSPLRSIAALTSWIKTDNADKFGKYSLQNFADIEATLENMENLISDILKFSSIEENEKEDEKIDLDKLVKKLIQILYVPEHLSINVKKRLPILKGDKIKFQQLFQNLISNAIKFSRANDAIVNIDYLEFQTHYKFSVQDNGIGIEKRHFDKIFKIFQFLKKSENSSGIGLSIVKKIVNIYKGDIWLESELNKGTTFYFTIKK
ncbi:MAG: ATP-binding protein [Polaribacter sp.]|nr:ATP-binding protein [Polaribacter sp.]